MLRNAFKRLRRLNNVTKSNLCIILLCIIVALLFLLVHHLIINHHLLEKLHGSES